MLDEIHLHNIRDRMLALRSLPNFAGLADDSLLVIAEHARERRFRRGDVLLDPATPLDRIFIAISGQVAMTRRGQPFTTIRAPGGVGVLAALAHDREGWGAIAEAPTVTLELPIDAFLTNLEEDFALLRNSLRLVSMRALDLRGNLPVRPDRASPAQLGTWPERDPTVCERVITMRAPGSPFANSNMDALIEICRRMTPMRVEAGHEFFAIGDPSTYSLRISYGRIRCTAASGEHVDVGAGMVLGAFDAFSARPRSFAARAETRVACHQTPIEDFLAVIEMHPQIGLSMLRGMAASVIAGG